jgi:predicted phosphodiesterase
MVKRVAVLSDVHANVIALEAVLAELDGAGADAIVFGGDLTAGPLPHETADLVRPLSGPLFVTGNGDRRVLAAAETEGDDRDHWLARAHRPEDLELLRRCRPTHSVDIAGIGATCFCHGSPRSDRECVTPLTPEDRMRELSAGIPEKVIVSAHIHVQFDREVAGLRSVNPGSIGMPYEGVAGIACWALIGPDQVDFRRTPYDLERAIALFEASGDPAVDEVIETIRHPATAEEAAKRAESQVFAG